MKTILFGVILSTFALGATTRAAGMDNGCCKRHTASAVKSTDAKVNALLAKAAEHEAMAKEFANMPNPDETKRPMSPRTAAHCRWLAAKYREEARKLQPQTNAAANVEQEACSGCCH